MKEDKQEYTVDDMRKVGYTLSPLVCIHCGSHEITYLQYLDYATCDECGEEQ